MTDHFAALGLPRRPWLEGDALKDTFHSLASAVHPDRVHGTDDATRHAADARHAALNSAYQTLREPKTRLQHLLTLERAARPGDLKTIPEDMVQRFSEVNGLLRQTDTLLATRTQAQSSLLRVQLLEKSIPLLEEISRAQAGLAARREALLVDLRTLDTRWTAAGQEASQRETDLAEAERLYHLLGFADRWATQLQERMMQLTL
jgi:DnaJ-domain-containing protein 1